MPTYYGVTPAYPSTVKTNFGTRQNFTEVVLAEHVNNLQAEVTSLETTLGTSVNVGSGWVGSFDQITTNWNSLKDRLANLEYGITSVIAKALPTGGTTGQVLIKTSGDNYAASWQTFNALPSYSGNQGKYLTTDGSTASWSALDLALNPLLFIGA